MNLIDLISKHPVPVTRFQRPYVIAEAGVNHEGSMDIARRLIDEAALGGADAHQIPDLQGGDPRLPSIPRPTGTPAKSRPRASTSCSKSTTPSGKANSKT